MEEYSLFEWSELNSGSTGFKFLNFFHKLIKAYIKILQVIIRPFKLKKVFKIVITWVFFIKKNYICKKKYKVKKDNFKTN